MREVTENDFRIPEYKDAKPQDYEFRLDGRLVRKDRWEAGIRRIASIVNRPRDFEIDDIVQSVRKLETMRSEISQIAQIVGAPCNCADIIAVVTRAMAAARKVESSYTITKDGDQWCAVGPGFIDLQQPEAAFADTPIDALYELNKILDPAGAATTGVAKAIKQIELAMVRNDAMQKSCDSGGDLWHGHETIDDRLHDALAALGE